METSSLPLFDNVDDLNTQLQPVLDSMHEVGILVDCEILNSLSKELADMIDEKENEVYRVIGHEFNLNSPKQIEEVLYTELKLPPGKRIKTGFSTNEQALQSLKDAHPIIPLLLAYRELYKLSSTYTEALPRAIKADGRIHSTFRSDKTATGRLSSSDPNLQNIPIRGEWGTKIRRAFIPSPGFILLSADYSQFEFRILAHFSGDAKLIGAFEKDIDIHKATAAAIFHKSENSITKDERRAAKTVNFGVLYGMSPHGLSEELGITHSQAVRFIGDYFATYAMVKSYIEGLLKQAQEKGYVETLSGFKREIPELKSENSFIRSAGERMAVNFPIQGSAAEIIKVAMVRIHRILQDKNMKSRLVLQIHDELLLEVPEDERDEVQNIIRQEMENNYSLRVPLRVEIAQGNNWTDMEKV